MGLVKKMRRLLLPLIENQAEFANRGGEPFFQFGMDRLQNGLPFRDAMLDFNKGTLAREASPLRAGLKRRLGNFGEGLPSGFREAALTDFDTGLARRFDDSVTNTLLLDEQARMAGASMIDPSRFFGNTLAGAETIGRFRKQPGFFKRLGAGAASKAVDLGIAKLATI